MLGPNLNDGLVVLARIALVGLQSLDGPVFDTEFGAGGRYILCGLVGALRAVLGHIWAYLTHDYNGVLHICKVFFTQIVNDC